MARVLLPLPEGFEEIEAVTVVDLLRRAGVEVRTASLAGRQVTGSHGIRIEADITLDDADVADYDMIVLPGGMPGADPLLFADLRYSITRTAPQIAPTSSTTIGSALSPKPISRLLGSAT